MATLWHKSIKRGYYHMKKINNCKTTMMCGLLAAVTICMFLILVALFIASPNSNADNQDATAHFQAEAAGKTKDANKTDYNTNTPKTEDEKEEFREIISGYIGWDNYQILADSQNILYIQYYISGAGIQNYSYTGTVQMVEPDETPKTLKNNENPGLYSFDTLSGYNNARILIDINNNVMYLRDDVTMFPMRNADGSIRVYKQ